MLRKKAKYKHVCFYTFKIRGLGDLGDSEREERERERERAVCSHGELQGVGATESTVDRFPGEHC